MSTGEHDVRAEGTETVSTFGPDPLQEFARRLARAALGEPEGGTAMTLATVDDDGVPSARIVLLKGVDARGFVFYTNYGSRKARALEASGRAALCFFWPSLAQQVRVEGTVERLGAAESDAYFASRPRGSQAGAWASRQSATLAARADLERRLAEVEERYAGQPIPRPPFWGGFLVRPEGIEFWEGQESRLHVRCRYERDGDHWTSRALYP